MRVSPVHGMDHVGITVPDIEAATRFFEAAFDAEVIYDSKTLSDEPDEGAETEQMLNLFLGTKVTAVRMVKLRNGPGLELFQMDSPEQREPVDRLTMGCSTLPSTPTTSRAPSLSSKPPAARCSASRRPSCSTPRKARATISAMAAPPGDR